MIKEIKFLYKKVMNNSMWGGMTPNGKALNCKEISCKLGVKMSTV